MKKIFRASQLEKIRLNLLENFSNNAITDWIAEVGIKTNELDRRWDTMDFKDLTPEQMEKIKDMSPEQLHEFVAEEGLPVSDEELEHVAGGWASDACPKGGDHDWEQTDDYDKGTIIVYVETCKKCGAKKESWSRGI